MMAKRPHPGCRPVARSFVQEADAVERNSGGIAVECVMDLSGIYLMSDFFRFRTTDWDIHFPQKAGRDAFTPLAPFHAG